MQLGMDGSSRQVVNHALNSGTRSKADRAVMTASGATRPFRKLQMSPRAIIGSRRGLLDQIAGVARPDGRSLWKSCFAEAVDIHLSLPLTGMGYPFRYSEMGLDLKDLGHRLPGFCISP
jgi:hypothetical protein